MKHDVLRAIGRRFPIGAEIRPGRGTHFRVWAANCRQVEAVIEGNPALGDNKQRVLLLQPETDGYFSGEAPDVAAGALYRFRLDGKAVYPDPASRFQPFGTTGPSQVVDGAGFPWTDASWTGRGVEHQVIYEMHVGTFTLEGTWDAARHQLPYLAETGITLLEIMPVAEFPGDFGWGYDGVLLFAPHHAYGRPEAMRAFVDEAHRLGVGVILDVVYHCHMTDTVLPHYSEAYVSKRYRNEWGSPANFDDRGSEQVRQFVLANARYWMEEFHLDGFRVDATQAYFDASPRHILGEIAAAARKDARGRRSVLVAENEPQQTRILRPYEQNGFAFDAMWNDDFHHAAMVRLTGRREAYYSDYLGSAEEFLAMARRGFLYQGQWFQWQHKPRGTPTLGLSASAFVNFLQNHDQVANSGLGKRIHELTSPGRFHAMTALWLLLPGTPMFFQGQEWGASSPFLYFRDISGERLKAAAASRAKFLSQFPSLALPESQARLADPGDHATFTRCKLDHSLRNAHRAIYALHQDLLRMRRDDPAFASQDAHRIEGAALGADAFVLRYFAGQHGDRLLMVNFGADWEVRPLSQSLLAPPEGCQWEMTWSSDDVKYGGAGNPSRSLQETCRLQGESTSVFRSIPTVPS